MLDRVRLYRQSVRNIARIAGVDGERKAVGVGLPRNRRQQSSIQPVINSRASAGLEDCLDAIDSVFLQVIDLLRSLGGSGRKASKLLLKFFADRRRKLLEVFGAMAPRRGKQWPASEELRTQPFSAIYLGTGFENGIQRIADAPHCSDSAVEIRREVAQHCFVGLVVAHVVIEAARRGEMNMHVDEAGKNRLASGFDSISLQGFRIGSAALIYFGNFAGTHQHGTVLNDLAVAYEN